MVNIYTVHTQLVMCKCWPISNVQCCVVVSHCSLRARCSDCEYGILRRFLSLRTYLTQGLRLSALDSSSSSSSMVVVVVCCRCSRAIVKNPDLLPDTPLWNLLVDDFWGTPLRHSGSHKSYRPLCVLTFRLNYLISGLQPFSYHLTNVVFHAGVTALYVLTVRKAVVGCPPEVVLLSGLLFAVHPVHSEAVAGVVGRADVLACFFFLLSQCTASCFRFRFLS